LIGLKQLQSTAYQLTPWKSKSLAPTTPLKKDKIPITVHDYLLNAEWCHGLESTEREGRYLLITTHSQIAGAREWLDENLESLFVDYLPNFGNFNPIEGHAFPTRGDKPRFSHQLGTYADQLKKLYTSNSSEESIPMKQWNRSPIHRPPTKRSFNFTEKEYPALTKTPTPNQKHTKPVQTVPTSTTNANHPTPIAKELREQIMADMKNDLTRMVSQEITNLHTELTGQLNTMTTTLKQDMNTQISDVIQTIAALNQRFNEVMEQLPPNPQPMPAHKKSKGLGITN